MSIRGDFKQKKFNGSANFKDENAALEFKGLINLNDSIPDFQFEMIVDTLDFYALNLLDEPLGISLKTQMDFSGNTLDDLNGKLLITEFTLQDSLNRIKEDSLSLCFETLTSIRRKFGKGVSVTVVIICHWRLAISSLSLVVVIAG